jgi:GNAT superfamily N-acetyltransferase
MGSMGAPTIRPMTTDDLDAATGAIVRGYWGDRRTWFEFATTQPECLPFVADDDGELVGTGVGTVNGSVGWVGTVFVVEARRREGLGRALTQAVIDALEDAGCRTLVLVATDMGRPLYERIGFEVQTRYSILEAPGLEGDPDEVPGIRPFGPPDIEAMIRLDRTATGEDRSHAIRRFASPATSRVALDVDGSLAGFVVRAPWGGGATVARSPEVAMRILEARRRVAGPGGRVRVGLIEENEAGLAVVERAGLTPVWSAPRMVRGEPMTWRPEWIWGQLNHAMG